MKKLAITLAALALAVSLPAQEKGFIDQNYIEITGRADREVTPDEIYLRIVIDEKDNKGRSSVEQQERDMIRRLGQLGIDVEKNLVVQDMSSDLKTFLLRRNTIYASKAYQLKVNSAAQLAQVFEQLNAIGISEVNLEKTSISNIRQIRDEIRIEAARNARQSARNLAEALGRTLGNALFIQDYGDAPMAVTYRSVMVKSVAMEDAAMATGQPELEFRKIRLEQSVLIRFALE